MLDDDTTGSDTGSGAADAGTEAAPPATRTRRRAASRPAGPPAAAAPSAEAVPVTTPAGGASTGAATTTPRKRAAKKPAKATAPSAEVAPDEVPAAASAAEDEVAAKPKRTRKKAAPAVFSAPKEPESADAVVPTAAETASVVLFQPPDPEQAEAPRRRSRSRARTPEVPADELDEGATDAVRLDFDSDADGRTEDEPGTEGDDDSGEGTARRRRRRGGRGRRGRGGRENEGAGDHGDQDDPSDDGGSESADTGGRGPADDAEGDSDDETSGTGTRRRRRRRRGGAADSDGSSDDPPNTVVRVREPRSRTASDEVTGVRGSTRLEAKKQRRREGREQGRRRPPILTESEFLARRESVDRVMLVRQTGDRTQIAVLEDGMLAEHYVNKAEATSFVGNVYLGRVQNVLPSMEAAFVDIGKGRNAVLYAGEVNWDAAALDGQPRRIEHALKSGDQVLVQVTKDPIGHKGSRLTVAGQPPGSFPGLCPRRLDDRHQSQAPRHRAHPPQGHPQDGRARGCRRDRPDRGRGGQRGGALPRRGPPGRPVGGHREEGQVRLGTGAALRRARPRGPRHP